jgi:putative transposase
MKRLVDTEEAGRILGVTPRAIRKWFGAGKIEGEFQKGPKGGYGGKKLFVWIGDPDGVPRRVGEAATPQGKTPQGKTPQGKDDKKRYRVHRGEPGCVIETLLENGMPTINDESKKPVGDGRGDPGAVIQLDVSSNRESPQIAILPSSLLPQPYGVGESTTPQAKPCEDSLPSQGTLFPVVQQAVLPITNINQERKGYLKFTIIDAYRKEIAKNGKPKGEAIKIFLEKYRAGILLPEVSKEIKKISISTLRHWDYLERAGGVKALIPQYHAPAARLITEIEKHVLLNCLLHQNRLKIGTAIKFTKTFLAYKKIDSPSSESRLRRFADDFRKTHYPTWVSAREGAKALNDKCLPYIERDWRLLTVGEGLVADGHRLNFQVINPFTGKPCRATIVLFWDWKSAYPLGWEIMIEESMQCIASALRNAILTLGKIPKWLLIDNGKAFKAKCFTSEIELEDGILYGMFATLGIHTHFSQAYNAQEKPLERFWGTFNNWFERLLPSYTGASINDKPAYMRRNEKEAQARHNKWIPKIEQIQELLHNWIDFYADQPSRGRDGMRPREIFEAEKGPGVDPAELCHLMMAKEKMRVHRNGVTFNGWHYFDEALSNIKDYVVGKYSLSDYSKIYCFYKNNFLCVAKPIEPVHPMTCETEFPKNQETVKRTTALKGRIKRKAKDLLTLIETGKDADLEHSFQKSPDVAEIVKAIEEKRRPSEIESLLIKDPPEDNSIPDAPEDESLLFRFAFERYEYLLKKETLDSVEKQFIKKYKAGIIAPGEYEHIYGERRLDRERKVCNH